MAESLRPGSQKEIGEHFKRGVKDIVDRIPVGFKDAVAARVTSGILGPLVQFAGELNYSPDQIAFLTQYATDAARITVLAAQREQEEIIAANPLFKLDLALFRTGEEHTLREKERLREIQREIKIEAQRVAGSQENEPSTDDIVNEMLKDKDRRWRTGLTGGTSRQVTNSVLVILGGDELVDRVNNESNNLAESRSMRMEFEAPTVFDGISSGITLSLRNGPPTYVIVDIILDRGAVKKVIEAPDLPPLPQE